MERKRLLRISAEAGRYCFFAGLATFELDPSRGRVLWLGLFCVTVERVSIRVGKLYLMLGYVETSVSKEQRGNESLR